MSFVSFKNITYKLFIHKSYIRGAYDKFPDFFRMGI